MIDPVVMYYDPKAKNQEIRPDDLNRLADEFRDVVIAELGNRFPVVNTPGRDVLRVRAAITEIIPASPALNAPDYPQLIRHRHTQHGRPPTRWQTL